MIARDILPTGFTPLLAAIVAEIEGCLGIVLVDSDGECVDYHTSDDPSAEAFELKVAGAQLQSLLLSELASDLRFGAAEELTIESRTFSFWVRRLPEDYFIALWLRPNSLRYEHRQVLDDGIALICREGGWQITALTPEPEKHARPRVRIEVDVDDKGRPIRLYSGGLTSEVDASVGRYLEGDDAAFLVSLRGDAKLSGRRICHEDAGWFEVD